MKVVSCYHSLLSDLKTKSDSKPMEIKRLPSIMKSAYIYEISGSDKLDEGMVSSMVGQRNLWPK